MDARLEADLETVKAYLEATMAGDTARAAKLVAPGFVCRFTGGREYRAPDGPVAFNARRYRRVAKQIERYDVIAAPEGTIVYSLGYLYGEWPDGTPFSRNRYVDRFTVGDGLIIDTDVWNDSAEWILDPSIARRGGE